MIMMMGKIKLYWRASIFFENRLLSVEFSLRNPTPKRWRLRSSPATDQLHVGARISLYGLSLFEITRKMSFEGDEAKENFFETPELVEMLLPFLNAKDTMNLAQSQLLNIKILQGPLIWNKLIRRTLRNPPDENLCDLDRVWLIEYMLGSRSLKPLIHILKIMKDHRPSQLDLLNLICERWPSKKPEQVVALHCSSNQTKLVSPLGFMLLEEVEGAFGSTEQCVGRINTDGRLYYGVLEGKLLPSLSARVARQREMVQRVEMKAIDVGYGGETLDRFATLVDGCQSMRVQDLRVDNPLELDEEDWSKLRRTLVSDQVSFSCFSPARDAILGRIIRQTTEGRPPARREDLRAIWDLTEDKWDVFTCTYSPGDNRYGNTYFHKDMGDEDWKRLEQLLDTG